MGSLAAAWRMPMTRATRARTRVRRAARAAAAGLALALGACGPGESEKPAAPAPPAAAPAPAAAAAPATPADLPRGLVLALAQFEGKQPGAARAEFLYREGGAWKTSALEDPESNVFHKAMAYTGPDGLRLLTLGGTAAAVKTWAPAGGKLEPAATLWKKDFGGKFSRMRDAEVADLMGDGRAAI